MTGILYVDQILSNTSSTALLTQTNSTTITLGASGQTVALGTSVSMSNFKSTGITDSGTTTVLSINSSGSVGIGTTSPNAKLNVYSASSIANLTQWNGGTSDGNFITIAKSGTTGATAGTSQFSLGMDYSTTYTDLCSIKFARTAGAGGIMQFFTAENANGSEVMRIDNNGNVGIGYTSSSAKFYVRSTPTGGNNVAVFENLQTSGNVIGVINVLQSNGNNTSSYHFAGLTQGVSFWYLYGNGTSSWTSDERKKKNIQTTRDGYLDDLCKLRVVKYNWNVDAEGTPPELGLIAQEVEQIFPRLVQDALDKDVDGIKYKTIKGSVLPYMLLKAIQELSAKVNQQQSTIAQLQADVAALKTKVGI